MALTPQQRTEYADMLAMGIPEDVVEEVDANITKYIAEWKKKVKEHVLKSGPKQAGS